MNVRVTIPSLHRRGPLGALVLGALLLTLVARADGQSLQASASLFVFDPAFTGGVTVGTCGPDAIGRLWVVTASATGGGLVRLFVGSPLVDPPALELVPVRDWYPYGPAWAGGVFVSCSVHSLKTHTEVWVSTGAAPGGGPHVVVWRIVY